MAYEGMDQQTLIGNIANNLIAMGNRTAPTSPADALMQLNMNKQKLKSMGITDTLQMNQEDRLKRKAELEVKKHELALQQQERARIALQSMGRPQGGQQSTQASFPQQLGNAIPGQNPPRQLGNAIPGQNPPQQLGNTNLEEIPGTSEYVNAKILEADITGDYEEAIKAINGLKKPMTMTEAAAAADRGGDRAQRLRMHMDDLSIETDKNEREKIQSLMDQETQQWKRQDRGEEKQAARVKSEANWQNAMLHTNNTLTTIEDAFKGTNWLTQGPLGSVLRLIPGTPMKDVDALEKMLTSDQVISAMAQVKSASENGSTGFGSMQRNEFDAILNLRTNLASTSSPEMKKRLLNRAYGYLSKIRNQLKKNGTSANYKYVEPDNIPGFNGEPVNDVKLPTAKDLGLPEGFEVIGVED
jgi:hypothetical protein